VRCPGAGEADVVWRLACWADKLGEPRYEVVNHLLLCLFFLLALGLGFGLFELALLLPIAMASKLTSGRNMATHCKRPQGCTVEARQSKDRTSLTMQLGERPLPP